MAEFKDYLPGGEKDPVKKEGLSAEIDEASLQQQARQEDTTSTPDVNWEDRYKELEKLNSRQAQTLGEYRKTIDDFIVNPTPDGEQSTSTEEHTPITYEDLYADADSAITSGATRAIDSHPAIQEVRKLQERLAQEEIDKQRAAFEDRHSDYKDLVGSPEFQNWVVDSPTRTDLYQRGHNYDFNAADALLSLYKAEKGMNAVQTQQDIDQASLVDSSGELTTEPPKYSRSEYIGKLTRARQGDLDAEDWVKRNSSGYRQALESGNVRD